MGKRYAEGTEVPVEKSRGEVESLLIKHGASAFASAWQDDVAIITFRMNGRMLRYVVQSTKPGDFAKAYPSHRHGWAASRERAAAAENRRRWRALLLILKAKLEIVASGDSSFDREFLADIMLPEGGTVGQVLVPQIEQAYATGEMPKLLGAGL